MSLSDRNNKQQLIKPTLGTVPAKVLYSFFMPPFPYNNQHKS